MPSLHYISHAVTLALIAMLIRKYIELKFHYDDLLSSCFPASPMQHIQDIEREMPDDDPVQYSWQPPDDPAILSPEYLNQELYSDGSSVMCNPTADISQRTCHFVNLCYFSEQDSYLFFHSEKSLVENIPSDRFSPTLLEVSSVRNHTYSYFNYVDMPVSASRLFQINWVATPVLLIKRFKPDNLMHVIHDDILPIYHRLKLSNLAGNSSKRFYTTLLFDDSWEGGQFLKLYNILSDSQPILKSHLKDTSNLTCFHSALVGLPKSTIWYDYGFHQPQAPIADQKVTAKEIGSMVEYVRREFGLALSTDKNDYLVLISRKSTRLILNEMELSLSLSRELGIKVVHVSQEQYSIEQLIEAVSNARGLIGMHGSLLTLAIFLPPGSFLIELFPYAVNPDHYTPYKTLVTLAGMDIEYRTWRNTDPKKSEGHPELGGLENLSQAEQNDIMDQVEVPLHICCDDPSWLYHIYQDTEVDIAAIVALTKSALRMANTDTERSTDKITDYIAPDKVVNTKCKFISTENASGKILISWEIPWNLQFFTYKKIDYEVLIQYTQGSTEPTLYRVTSSPFSMSVANTSFLLWVHCVLDNIHFGPFTQVTCE